MITLKSKLSLGMLFLFISILALGVLGFYYINRLSAEAEHILTDNYKSLQYCNQMLALTDETTVNDTWVSAFGKALASQEQNITEQGERESSARLRIQFERLRMKPADRARMHAVKEQLHEIIRMNQKAIEKKNAIAMNTAAVAKSQIAVIGTLLILLTFVFVINFPGYIAKPLHTITEDIRQITERDAAKTNFIATVSHELKTPVSAIRMSTKLLNDNRVGSTNTEQKQLIKNIEDDANRLLRIIAELLDMAQIETGNIHLNMKEVRPGEIIRYAISAIETQAQQQHIIIKINAPPHDPLINADPEKTAWVLINLLSNAIRYSNAGSSIIIEVKEVINQVAFSVRDFGKGIALEYRDKIFDRFFQVPGSQQGTGLGLAICKEFIEAQGGALRLEASNNEGSCFTFTLYKTS